MYIDDLNFTTRTRNVLKRAGIFETSQLLSIPLETLSEKKGVGKQVLDEVTDVIEKLKADTPVETIKEPTPHNINDKYSVVRVLCRIPNNVVIKSIKFREQENAQWVDDLPITSIARAITPTILDSLINLKIETTADLAATPEEDIRRIPRIGSTAIQRLYIYFKNNVKLELFDESVRINADLEYINEQINDKCFIFKELPEIVKGEIISNPELSHDKDIVNNIWKQPTIFIYIVSCVQHQVFLSNDWLTHDDIIAMLPEIVVQNIDINEIFEALNSSSNIDCLDDMYRGHKKSLEEWIEGLDVETQGMIRMRLKDAALSEIADIYGCTRERVRQRINHALYKCPTLREDENAYWFTRYNISKDCFMKVWGISEIVFNYLRIKYRPGGVPISEIFEDSSLTTELADKLNEYILGNKILIGNEHVERDQRTIVYALGREYCYESSISIEELYRYYNDCLDSSKVSSEDKLRFISIRSFKKYITEKPFYYCFDSGRVRYYDQTTDQYLFMLSQLRLERYYDVEISTRLLFQSNTKLMKKYNVQDEYELHRIIAKYIEYLEEESTDSESKISLGEPPLIMFGTPDREEQVKRLLFELSPVTKERFINTYEQKYGVDKKTIRKYYITSIEQYNQAGTYTLTDNGLTQEERTYLKRSLQSWFYFIDDIERRFANKFGEACLYKINPQTLAEFGYKSYSTYVIISKYYSTSREYFLDRFLERGQIYYTFGNDEPAVVDLSKDKDILNSISVARSALSELTSQLKLIQIKEYKYIKQSDLDRYISIVSLMDFLNSIPNYTSNEFFTVKSLINNGIHNPLEILGYKDMPMQYLIKNSRKYNYFRIDDAIVFYIGKTKQTLLDFIADNMTNISWIKVNDLINLVFKSYGIKLSREMIMNTINDSAIKYDDFADMLTLEQ